MKPIAASELILTPEGRIYHLNLAPEDIATNIITVGDPERVHAVSKHFDTIEVKVQKREFVTHTGTIGGKRLSVVSTGIGTDNIDIVFNELDALANIDFSTRLPKKEHTVLNFIRIGTTGGLQADIPVDSFLASAYGVGLGGLLHFYPLAYNENEQALTQQFPNLDNKVFPYVAQASEDLLNLLADDITRGITITCPGFYGPQFRSLRIQAAMSDLFDELKDFSYQNLRITNFEMETAGIYGMARLLGHRALSLNAILANRSQKQFSADPKAIVNRLIERTLARIVKVL